MANLPDSWLWPPLVLGEALSLLRAACHSGAANPQPPIPGLLPLDRKCRAHHGLRSPTRRNHLRRLRAPTRPHGAGTLIPTGPRCFSRSCPAPSCLRPNSRKSASIPPSSAPHFAPPSKRPSCARFKRCSIAQKSPPPNKLGRARPFCANASAPNVSAASGFCDCRPAPASGGNCGTRGVPGRLLALAIAHALQYGLWILAWYLVGSHVLSGGTDRGWLIPWALLLLTLVPLRVLITRLQGWAAIGAGALMKQRLFFGSLRLDPDSLRHQGAGQLLGRVLESEAVEALALERRLSRPAGAHRNYRRDLRAGGRRGRPAAIGAALPLAPGRGCHRVEVFSSAIATGLKFAWR